MSTTELKSEIIKHISTTEDDSILEEIRKFLKIGEFYEEEVYVFSKEQQEKVNRALQQYHNGECISDEEAQNDILKWIEE